MAKFYFKIQDQEDVFQPDRSFEFSGLDEAESEAKLLLAEIAVDGLPRGKLDCLAVELQDENHVPLITVRLVMEVIPHGVHEA
ncbi:DUF6894 family protein [Shinella lacus]|uniref:DUF6894 domain-containing protein n=1 Tax=Shinella lacus TaxID=2654216 RepID=A0ABT1R268_9HYPH|nr:hypothetical protein [Shinella lacus]MCQ4629264.1 hypothetical protein [Shinella lacus]